eukprot:4312611-Amphidinium_carterae.1
MSYEIGILKVFCSKESEIAKQVSYLSLTYKGVSFDDNYKPTTLSPKLPGLTQSPIPNRAASPQI